MGRPRKPIQPSLFEKDYSKPSIPPPARFTKPQLILMSKRQLRLAWSTAPDDDMLKQEFAERNLSLPSIEIEQ